MGFFSSLIGNVSEVEIEGVVKNFEQLIAEGEVVEAAYKLVRDMIIFTNKRIIFIDKQGITAKKIEYLSVPYKSINTYSVETVGHFDLEAELVLHIKGMESPIIKQFTSSANIYDVQSIITKHIE
ncbi:PH domain-containing protein [Hathewaya proteolytica DSM 3090]|uniref:PH domain-containing protein n=1 Tax=Hathewaya proteolytica DSM 3090 TaxID=1121331 RepID=A0A1M6MGN0_9CLOT|nr:PH domain-containing protein [Hathewaya proteolytica]SHJ82598.1 PH domain-containing protein [Hathewaya proteolytica DSM 3090]